MEKEQKKQGGRRIILVGDSTMCDYSVTQYLRNLAPQEGWGMHLQAKCRNNTEVLNCASAGKSTRTYEKEGLWKQALAKIRKDDFVVIGMVEVTPPERFDGKSVELRINLKNAVGSFSAGEQIIKFEPQRDRHEEQLREFARIVRGEIENPYTYEHDLAVHKLTLAAAGYIKW